MGIIAGPCSGVPVRIAMRARAAFPRTQTDGGCSLRRRPSECIRGIRALADATTAHLAVCAIYPWMSYGDGSAAVLDSQRV